jgi:carboxyl-terminal processing protease
MKLQKKYIPLLLGIAVAFGILVGGKLDFADDSDRLFTSNSKKDKLNRLIDYIDYEYVDDVNTDSIVDVTVNGILNNLDPHSTYIPKKDLQRITENMKGDFVGIGISFYTYKDSVTVIKAIDGGPSKLAGIKAGDRIILADGDSIFGKQWKDSEIVSKLKGKKNSIVNLKIHRKGEASLLNFNVKRKDIPIKSVDAVYMLNASLGYIKVNRFAESTYKEFKKGLDKLQDQGATKLVLDLRDNPGGFLTIAEQIADEFLEDDKLILFTKNKRGKIENSFATNKGDFEEGEIYVLINENSASASEIVAGALQDNDKGTIVGRRSYGKGLVQREMSLGDGSAVRLTVSRYYTPTGRSIQRPYKKGKGNKDYYGEYYERIVKGELSDVSKIQVADSLMFKTPKGKTVYGGGGIIPDVFVPIDKKMNNETLSYIVNNGIMNYFMFEELDKDRAAYQKLSLQELIDDYTITDEMVMNFKNYINKRSRYKITFAAYTNEVKIYLKATLAEQLFDSDAYYKIVNFRDNMVEEVLKLSKNY